MGKVVANSWNLLRAPYGALLAACAAHSAAPTASAVVDVPAAIAAPSSAPAAPAPRAPACRDGVLVSHAESDDAQLNASAAFTGHWYTYVDSFGSHVVPWPPNVAGGGFSMSPGGKSAPYAAHMLGETTRGANVFAGMGASFFEPKRTFDASAFAGIELWAKRGADSNPSVWILLADSNTDPDGGVCSECFNYFGTYLTLDREWSLHRVPFFALEQQPNWGEPRPAHLNAAALYGFQLRVAESEAAFDVWVDDVRFVGCAGEPFDK